MTVRTLSDLVFYLRESASASSDLVTVRWPEQKESLSRTDFLRGIHCLSLAFEERGLRPGERVAIYSESRPEWHVVDLACQMLGLVTVPVDPGLSSRHLGFILRNSGCKWVFFSNGEKRNRLLELQSQLTEPVQLVAMEIEAKVPGGLTLTGLQGEGASRLGETPLERFRGRTGEDDLATLLYTAGTTGDPKGVMLSQRSLVSSFRACGEVFELGAGDRALSFLPLSHGLQRTIDHLCFFRGVPVHYVPALEQVPEALLEVRPTLLAASPRVYEAAFRRARKKALEEALWRRLLFHWACEIGEKYQRVARRGFVGPFLALQRVIADTFVFRRIRASFGGSLRIAISSGGPMGEHAGSFFQWIGMPIYQGYGLAEISPLLTSNVPGDERAGSVGKVLADLDLRVGSDGEILVRGPSVMLGYWENQGATEASVDDSGWLHTGDLGRIDQSGYLFITDRKQAILVTTEGKRIAPLPIETQLVSHGIFSHAIVVGDDAPFLGALLVPDLVWLRARHGDLPTSELLALPEVVEQIEAIVERVNANLSEDEKIRGYRLIPEGLSIERGELTSSLKVRRRVVTQRHAERIQEIYSTSS